jgi:hypothetical protein
MRVTDLHSNTHYESKKLMLYSFYTILSGSIHSPSQCSVFLSIQINSTCSSLVSWVTKPPGFIAVTDVSEKPAAAQSPRVLLTRFPTGLPATLRWMQTVGSFDTMVIVQDVIGVFTQNITIYNFTTVKASNLVILFRELLIFPSLTSMHPLSRFLIVCECMFMCMYMYVCMYEILHEKM